MGDYLCIAQRLALKANYVHKMLVPENYLQIPWYADKSRCDEVDER